MLRLKNITKTYITGEIRQDALRGVSLCFRDSEFVSILGHSGSGKTTLLNIVGGLDGYTSGDLEINGVSTKSYSPRDWDTYRNHSVGFVFQSYNLIPHQTVLANVELALTLSGVSKSERRRRAMLALEEVGLGDQGHKKPNQMSGGQMQRVAIARALINNPDILLADEPTGALDSDTSVQIMGLLEKISKKRLVVMVTHNPELAERYSTRIIRLNDGRITDDSDPFEPQQGVAAEAQKSRRMRSMSFFTAMSLSLNNLMTKKARTILTAFAGSIGIIGIALILSVSTGFQGYIDKVQEDTLSTYPLTIMSETADMSAMMAAFGETLGDTSETEPGAVEEVRIMSGVFAKIGFNDLAAFKEHLESSMDEVGGCLNALQYGYSVTPQIYLTDVSEGAKRVNPNSLFSSMMDGMSGYSSMMGADMFYEMIDNRELLETQYRVVAGRWPETRNELLLVLGDSGKMSDFMAYSLGLRDGDEFSDMMETVLAGETYTDSGTPLKWSYDELLGLKYSLVLPADRYSYNEEYEVWEDMSDNDGFMRSLVLGGEELSVVGIVCPLEGASASALSQGIAYLPELTRYIMDTSESKPAVQSQLASPEVDVFTGLTFDELNNGERESLDFDDMISVDTDMLSSAFGVNISEDYIKTLTSGYMDRISGAITTDTSAARTEFTAALESMCREMLSDFLAQNADPVQGVAMLDVSLADTLGAAQLAKESSRGLISGLTARYLVPAEVFDGVYGPLLSGAVAGYVTAATGGAGTSAPLAQTALEPFIAAYIANPAVTSAAEKMGGAMTEAVMQRDILTAVGELSAELVSSVAGAFNVDESRIASAFSFNLDEEELTRLMQAYSSQDDERTAQKNLAALGYADIDKPTSISVYLADFEAKERFIAFIDDYNDRAERDGREDMVISYTDMTGVLMSSVKTIVDSVSYVLIAFVAISLVVSSIMIGVITYISVLERTKEIGILRAIGASKRDVSRVFNAETVIIGLASGLLGIGVSLLLLLPINAILYSLTGIASLKAVLPAGASVVLVAISVVLTLTAGLIPSGIASRKNPVEALRSE